MFGLYHIGIFVCYCNFNCFVVGFVLSLLVCHYQNSRKNNFACWASKSSWGPNVRPYNGTLLVKLQTTNYKLEISIVNSFNSTLILLFNFDVYTNSYKSNDEHYIFLIEVRYIKMEVVINAKIRKICTFTYLQTIKKMKPNIGQQELFVYLP